MSDYHFTCTKNHICCSGLSLNAENEPVRTRPDVWGWQIFSVRRRHTEYLSIPVSPVSSAFTHPTSMWLSSSSASAICTASSQSDVCLSLSSSSVFFLASSVPVFMQHWLHFTMVSAPPLSPRLRPPPLRQFYYSMWWCSLHWQISGDGSLEGNDDTVRQPLSSTACNHLLKDSTSCDMQ